MSPMFLSRARLGAGASVRALAPLLLPADGAARLLAAHRLVWSLMSDGAERRRDFLWREEAPGSFLILAPRPAASEGGLFDVDSKPWEPALREGDRLGFLLRANPTVSRAGTGGVRKRSDVVMDALFQTPKPERAAARPAAMVSAGTAWLARLGGRHGFAFNPAEVGIDGYDLVRVPRDDAKPVEFAKLEFEGALEVTDPAAFVAAVTQGFGRARAFGCGLMLLRRA